MNRIVREHYPADRLPDDLREGLRAETVRLTIEIDPPAPFSLEALAEAARLRRAEGLEASENDPVARVRSLRDEWDRRDEWHERIRSGDS